MLEPYEKLQKNRNAHHELDSARVGNEPSASNDPSNPCKSQLTNLPGPTMRLLASVLQRLSTRRRGVRRSSSSPPLPSALESKLSSNTHLEGTGVKFLDSVQRAGSLDPGSSSFGSDNEFVTSYFHEPHTRELKRFIENLRDVVDHVSVSQRSQDPIAQPQLLLDNGAKLFSVADSEGDADVNFTALLPNPDLDGLSPRSSRAEVSRILIAAVAPLSSPNFRFARSFGVSSSDCFIDPTIRSERMFNIDDSTVRFLINSVCCG